MPILTVNGVNLHYEVHGEGAPVLGIHGTPSSALLWEDAAERLGHHSRCVIYDRRGFFRSERPDPFEAVDLTDHVQDAAALLEALSATPAVVIGRSTGGVIALELARRHPEKVAALVLLEPALLTLDPQAAAWAEHLRRNVLAAAAEDPTAASEAVFRQALGDEAWESFPQQLRDHFTAASPAVLAEIRGRGLDLSQAPLTLSTEEAAGIRQPTLIVSAQDSPEALHAINRRLAELLPDTESVLVPGGHLLDPAGPAVLDFLTRHLTPPPKRHRP
ncbi:alpha/beta fold hydrolase [Kocuria sp. M1R5S2]|uniref:alpha/beta fold hydrolase n=1 Tax=Kocuria rhizosphaerae TaxID=3376285 RepID=UPI0037A96E71